MICVGQEFWGFKYCRLIRIFQEKALEMPKENLEFCS